MKLNQAVGLRLQQLLQENDMTPYQLSSRSGVPKSTISNLLHCTYDSVKLRIIHELCQGFSISISEFFASSLFDEDNLDP